MGISMLNVLMVGDVVGDPGLMVLENHLPDLIKEHSIDFTVVNGENAADGFGLLAPHLERIFAAGADVVTSGNHIWEKREIWPLLNSEKRLLRPMNYPDNADMEWNDEKTGTVFGTPGRGWVKLEKSPLNGEPPISWLVVNLQGRELLSSIDCPFRAFDCLESEIKNPPPDGLPLLNPVILVDFHAESTREKEALAYYLDGRVSVIAGTHTHVQTADERILPKGSAYITDLGMTGFLGGVIGMDANICINRARSQVLYRMEVATPEATDGSSAGSNTAVQGIIVEIEKETRKALSIKRLSSF